MKRIVALVVLVALVSLPRFNVSAQTASDTAMTAATVAATGRLRSMLSTPLTVRSRRRAAVALSRPYGGAGARTTSNAPSV